MDLPKGKVSPYELKDLIFERMEIEDEKVLVKPDVGIDASIIDMGDQVLAFSSDPITGSLKNPGWLSVHVNANDVASMGAQPKWFLLTIFMPENTEKKDIENVLDGADKACKQLGISLVGGHTEVTPGLDRVLISGSMAGIASEDEWVSSSGAKPGDKIILTKNPGLEATFILSMDKEEELKDRFGSEMVDNAKKYGDRLSVVEEALTAIETGKVHAMHDPTEGGLVGGLFELADASEVGFSLRSENIEILEETKKFCNYFDLDPLRIISSGSLLIVASPENSEEIVDSIREKGVKSFEIGEILRNEDKREIDGESADFPERDELWKIF